MTVSRRSWGSRRNVSIKREDGQTGFCEACEKSKDRAGTARAPGGVRKPSGSLSEQVHNEKGPAQTTAVPGRKPCRMHRCVEGENSTTRLGQREGRAGESGVVLGRLGLELQSVHALDVVLEELVDDAMLLDHRKTLERLVLDRDGVKGAASACDKGRGRQEMSREVI